MAEDGHSIICRTDRYELVGRGQCREFLDISSMSHRTGQSPYLIRIVIGPRGVYRLLTIHIGQSAGQLGVHHERGGGSSLLFLGIAVQSSMIVRATLDKRLRAIDPSDQALALHASVNHPQPNIPPHTFLSTAMVIGASSSLLSLNSFVYVTFCPSCVTLHNFYFRQSAIRHEMLI